MTAAEKGLHAAGLALEEDIRKMDAGELHATPEQRAFLMGAKNAFLKQRAAESGGYPVDSHPAAPPTGQETLGIKVADVLDPQNRGLADRQTQTVDGGLPSDRQDGPRIDGGTTAALDLPAGLYWLGTLALGAGPSVTHGSGAFPGVGGTSAAAIVETTYAGYSITGLTDLPAAPGAADPASSVPIVAVILQDTPA